MAHNASQRLQRLEDERAIIDRLYEYVHSMDHGPQARLRDCFTEDRSVEGRWQGVVEQRSSGRPSWPWKQVPNTKHLVSCPRVISLDGQIADVESYWMYITEDGGSPQIQSFGRYLDRMRKGRDGKWRIWLRVVDSEGRNEERRKRASAPL